VTGGERAARRLVLCNGGREAEPVRLYVRDLAPLGPCDARHPLPWMPRAKVLLVGRRCERKSDRLSHHLSPGKAVNMKFVLQDL
jgi:hypothetical protein